MLAGLITQAAGGDPAQINYVAYSGGGEAIAAMLGGQVTAGVSGYGEWQPQIESGDLLLAIEVDVRPDIELPAYDGLELTVDSVEIGDDEVTEELDRLRSRFGTLITVDRPAKTGDFVTLDLVAVIDGTEVDSGKVWYGDKELRATLDDGTEIEVVVHSGMVGELTRAQLRQAGGTWSDLARR